MVACTQGVFGWVEQGQHACFLVIVHAVIPKQRQRHDKQNNGGEQCFPRQSGKKDDEKSGCHNQGGGAQIGLLQDERAGQQNQPHGGKVVIPRQPAFKTLEKPRQHHRQADFHNLRRLKAHNAQIEPPCRTVHGNAEKMHAQQQQHAQNVNRQGEMTQNLRPDTRKHQQQHNADNGVQGFAF